MTQKKRRQVVAFFNYCNRSADTRPFLAFICIFDIWKSVFSLARELRKCL